MLRWLLLRLSERPMVADAVTASPSARRVVERFVAGEDLEDGLAAARHLVDAGADVTLDHVGEHATSLAHAERAAAIYRGLLARLRAEELPAGLSVKPTQLGLLVDPDRCAELLSVVASQAAAVAAPVTLDMEDHRVTEATVALVERLHAAGHTHVGCALQSALHRTPEDLRRLTRVGASIRLCKGAYAEPSHVAWQRRHEVDRAWLEGARYLLREADDPRFATHDHRLVALVKREAARLGRDRGGFEFQMLYGVRPPMQAALTRDGYRLRVYVPFGSEWFPYFTRRLAERPANLRFFLRALFRGGRHE